MASERTPHLSPETATAAAKLGGASREGAASRRARWLAAEVERRLEGSDERQARSDDSSKGKAAAVEAEEAEDLLAALLATGARLGADEALDVLKDVMTAGVETTAATLTTAALLLRQHPEAATRVAAEAHAAGLHCIEPAGVATEWACASSAPSPFVCGVKSFYQ